MSSARRSVVLEVDGGSRGNPGPAAYGAVLKDAVSGEVIVEEGMTIGVATNNVAEYSGLVAGLRLVGEFAPGASVEVRMDSQLVVEQVQGRWKVKHPDLVPLVAQVRELAPPGTTYTWVPREQNKHADLLVNEALDGKREGVTPAGPRPEPESLIEELEFSGEVAIAPTSPTGTPQQGWSAPGAQTTLVLVRHGVTMHTAEKRFSGGLASANPGLSDDGRDQVRATAAWLAPLVERIDVVVSSPVRRTLETAEIFGAVLGRPVVVEAGFAEMEFGHWDGLTFGEVAAQHPEELESWLGSVDAVPTGGESFRQVEARVLASLDTVLAEHAGKTVVVVSHVTPIKTVVAHVLGAPLEAVFRMELSPASVTVVSFPVAAPDDGQPRHASLRLYNALPPGEGNRSDTARW